MAEEQSELVTLIVGRLDDLKERLIVIETEMRRVTNLEVKLDETTKTADKALASTQSAHKRLDKFDDDITWLKRAVIGGFITFAFTLTGGIILFLITR